MSINCNQLRQLCPQNRGSHFPLYMLTSGHGSCRDFLRRRGVSAVLTHRYDAIRYIYTILREMSIEKRGRDGNKRNRRLPYGGSSARRDSYLYRRDTASDAANSCFRRYTRRGLPAAVRREECRFILIHTRSGLFRNQFAVPHSAAALRFDLLSARLSFTCDTSAGGVLSSIFISLKNEYWF